MTSGRERLLTEELLMRFGSERLRIYSPNIKPDIVGKMRALGANDSVVTSVGCACAFNDRFSDAIKAHGGLDIVMLDGFGGFKSNIHPLLEQMIKLKLFRPDAGVGARPSVAMMMVMSNRPARVEKKNVDEAAREAHTWISTLFADSDWVFTPDHDYDYGRSMCLFAGTVTSRDRRLDAPPGFQYITVLQEVMSSSQETGGVTKKQKIGDLKSDTFQSSALDTNNETAEVEEAASNTTENEMDTKEESTSCFTLEMKKTKKKDSKDLLPFDATRLRCHPMWSQLLTRDEQTKRTTIGSHVQLVWQCSECNEMIYTSPRAMSKSSGRCKKHTKKITKIRKRYMGDIPVDIRIVLRAAVLQNLTNPEIHSVVKGIKPAEEKSIDSWIKEMKNISKIDLLDNGYWWFDVASRLNGPRYKWKKVKKIKDEETESLQPLVQSNEI